MGASSGIEPVNSSAQNSKTCGEVMSSNCVKWAGGGQLGDLTICEGASITDVITQIATGCCGGGGGGVPASPCAAAGWTNTPNPSFVSGSGASATWLNSGTFSSWIAGWAPLATDVPAYRYLNDGNIALRGAFEVEFNVGAQVGHVIMDMGTVNTSCFPTTFNKAQVVLTEVELRDVQKVVEFMKAYAVLHPSGSLQLYIYYDFGIFPNAYRWSISLGGVVFNIQ